jgi:hypothetical protein
LAVTCTSHCSLYINFMYMQLGRGSPPPDFLKKNNKGKDPYMPMPDSQM